MSKVPHPAGGDTGEPGAVLVLLTGAASSFRTVHVTYRTWRHEQRLQEAFRIHHAQQRRRGVTTGSAAPAVRGGDSGPVETKETMRIWREGQRTRHERHGGSLDGSYGVVDGPLWWYWSKQKGAISNQDDPRVIGGGIAQELQVMLNPGSLPSVMAFQVAGRFQIAGRATITAHASPRHEALVDRLPSLYGRHDLHALGVGADSYQLEVDQERGVLLAATAIHNEQPFYKVTALAIRFDEPIPPETFQFSPPEGEQIQSPRAAVRNPPELVPLTEAQQRAAFAVLIPDRMPSGWQMYCTFSEVCQHPPSQAPHVLLNYRSADGRQNVTISQVAAADASRHYGSIMGDESWSEVLRDGTSIKIRSAGELRPAQAHLTRLGTSVRLSSHSLDADELATIAADLWPAPDTDFA